MSSYRSDNHASYDHGLLSSVPGPTRQEKQEGYDVDLLEGGHEPRAPSPPTAGATSEHNAVLDYSPAAVSIARSKEPLTTNDYEAVEKRVPWYRTRKGKIGIAVVVLVVIIAAAVGGGVGGSHHSHKNGASSNQMGQTHNSTAGVGQNSNSPSSTTSPSASTNVGSLAFTAPTASPGAGGGGGGNGTR